MTPIWCIDDPHFGLGFHKKFRVFLFVGGCRRNNRCICHYRSHWFTPFSCYHHSRLGQIFLCYYPCIGSLSEDVSIELLGSSQFYVTIHVLVQSSTPLLSLTLFRSQLVLPSNTLAQFCIMLLSWTLFIICIIPQSFRPSNSERLSRGHGPGWKWHKVSEVSPRVPSHTIH